MVKRILAAALSAAFALAAVSCSEQEEDRIPDSMEEVTLSCETQDLALTRTQIDSDGSLGGSVGILWSPGDSIGVFGSATLNAKFTGTFSAATTSGLFAGQMLTDDTPKYAYYPYVKGAEDMKAVPATVGSAQLYEGPESFGDYDIKASSTPILTNGAYRFVFTPLVSIIRTEIVFGSKLSDVARTEKLQSIVFNVNPGNTDAARHLTGNYTFDLTDLSSGLKAVEGETSSSVTVNLSSEDNGGQSVGSKIIAYCSIAPVIRKGDVIRIQLLTDKHSVTFDVNALKDFVAGACYDVRLTLDNLTEKNNVSVTRTDAVAPVFEKFGFEISKNTSSLLAKTAYLNGNSTSVKAAEDFDCAIDESLGTVSCCIPYLYNFTLAPTFSVASGVKVLVNGKEQQSGVTAQDFSSPVEYTLTDGTSSRTYTVSVTNTGLPVAVIDVNSSGTVDFLDFRVPAKTADFTESDTFAVYVNGEADVETSSCGVRVRGNSSANYDKRPLAIKLAKKSQVLGMPKSKRWILLSPWTDMSLIRNYLAFNIAQTIQNHFINGATDGSEKGRGMLWNPSGKNVELVINGIHAGNYLLCEQIKIEENRLNISDPYEDVIEENSSATINDCGFLLEFDNYYDETWKFKTTYRQLPCQLKDDLANTKNGRSVFSDLKSFINAIEYNLVNGNYTEAYKSLDINSVIDYWLVYEISMNDELQHPRSAYMIKDGAGKLTAGPVWDFDSQNFTNVDTEKNSYYYHTWSSLLIERSKSGEGKMYLWYPLLMKDQNYIDRVKARWADVYPDLVNLANTVVEERRSANKVSDYYNRKIWKVGNYLDERWLCGDEEMEFDAVMDNLKYCYNKRLENLNTTITNLTRWTN